MNNLITIVSGLPRSGTSMMMKMLDAGGFEVVADNMRKADEDNPGGYYEYENVKKIREDASWLDDTRGKVFKMVSMLLYHLPPDRSYKIIFMRRKTEEILASQKKMLERNGLAGRGPSDADMEKIYSKHLEETEMWLAAQKNIDVFYVSYNDMIDDPSGNVGMLNRFLGGRLDAGKMVESVDRSLYRNRR